MVFDIIVSLSLTTRTPSLWRRWRTMSSSSFPRFLASCLPSLVMVVMAYECFQQLVFWKNPCKWDKISGQSAEKVCCCEDPPVNSCSLKSDLSRRSLKISEILSTVGFLEKWETSVAASWLSKQASMPTEQWVTHSHSAQCTITCPFLTKESYSCLPD